MPTPKKTEIVQNLSEKLAQTRGVILTDYQGLNTARLEALREKLKEGECGFQVVKNTLLQIGLAKSSYPKIKLDGPTAVVFVYKDIFSALRILEEYAKVEGSPKIKSGFLEKQFISQDRLEELAKIPSVDYLKGFVISSLDSPINNLVSVLSWNLNQLIYVLWLRHNSWSEPLEVGTET